MEIHHDIVVTLDIIVGVPAKTEEDAMDIIARLSTKELLKLAIKQLPFTELITELSSNKTITIN